MERRLLLSSHGYPLASNGAIIPCMRAIALLLLLAGAVPAFAQEPDTTTPTVLPANERIAGVFDLVYQLKTATDAKAPKASYGSGFVVDKSGLLATNFHVVSSALHEPGRYRLYFVDGETVLPATVIAFDAVNDLALVKVQRTFEKAVPFAHRNPVVGAKIYSIGLPEDLNKSVIEGNFNGSAAEGPYHKLQMSIPLNPGMSGGPTINAAGELVGVNVSIRIDSQSLAFAVPREQVAALMKREPGNFAGEDAGDAFDEELRDQLDNLQDALSQNLLKGKTEPVRFAGWSARKPAEWVKCWRESENGLKDLSSFTTEFCYLPNTSPIRHDADTGTFRLKYGVVASSRLNPWQFLHTVNDNYTASAFNMVDYLESFTTKFECGELDLVNANKVPFRVHYCLNGYVRFEGLYQFEFEAVTLSQGRSSLVVAASLAGFSARNATEITRALLDGVKAEEAAP